MNEFRIQVVELLDNGGAKGYNTALRSICKALPHALGEIIYKVVRYHAKHDLRDLVKIAAWAELEWESSNANGKGSSLGNRKVPPFTWPSYPKLVAGRVDLVSGGPGGGAGGARRGEPTKTVWDIPGLDTQFEDRTGASGGRRRTVGGKHRRRTRKGKP